MDSSCDNKCTSSGRHFKIPTSHLDQVRKKLDLSETGEGAFKGTSPAPVRYGEFKKVAEKHSDQNMKPRYTSAELAAVPDSFLELFKSRIGPDLGVSATSGSPRAARSPVRSPRDVEMSESFLEYCRDRMACQTPTSGAASGASPRYGSSGPPVSYYGPYGPSPSNGTSYYGGGIYDNPGQQNTCIFSPKRTSTRIEASPTRSPRSPPYQQPPAARSPLPPEYGYGNYRYPVRPTTSPAVGIGKFACPASDAPPTPPTPSFVRRAPCSTIGDTISSGDLSPPSPQNRSRCMSRSRGQSLNITSPGYPAVQSTPENPLMNNLRPTVNRSVSPSTGRSSARHTSSNLSVRRRGPYETLDTDDLLAESGKSGCPGCPTLGVTPIQSSVSISFSSTENTSISNKQNISKSIENELLAREEQERSQLETDLLRWQQARRRLVMNTASMGS